MTFSKRCQRTIFNINKWTTFFAALAATLLLHGCGGKPLPDDSAKLPCTAPSGAAITDVQSVVDWLNAMPKPLSLPCFIESLPRPLKIQPAFSVFSAQPSPNQKSPRIFLFFDRLIMTVAIDQDFAEFPYPLLEMSYLVDEENLITTKAELKFPITETLSPVAPYTGLSFNDRSSQCSFCHPAESTFGELDGIPIYQSSILKPTEPLPVNQLYVENDNCVAEVQPHRCAMLASIVDHGDLLPYSFPGRAPTIFDN